MNRQDVVAQILRALPKSKFPPTPQSSTVEGRLNNMVPQDVAALAISDANPNSTVLLEALMATGDGRCVAIMIQSDQVDAFTFSRSDIIIARLNMGDQLTFLEIRMTGWSWTSRKKAGGDADLLKLFEILRA